MTCAKLSRFGDLTPTRLRRPDALISADLRRPRRPRLGGRAQLAFAPLLGCPVSNWNAKQKNHSAWSTIPSMFLDNLNVTFYRRNLPHLQRDAKPHFITFCTKKRWILPDWARHIVLSCCQRDDGVRYDLHVAVVMPDHVHVILTPLTDFERGLVIPLAEITKALKGSSSHAINARAPRGTVWQVESFDHVLRSSESLDAKIQYVLENPVRKRLVHDWNEYPWLWCRPVQNPYAPPRIA